jgi:signal transduction histidine kinase
MNVVATFEQYSGNTPRTQLRTNRMEESQSPPAAAKQKQHIQAQPAFMHPVIFLGMWVLLGTLFALQEWMNLRRWGYHMSLVTELESWDAEFLIWGILNWSMWRIAGSYIQDAALGRVVIRMIPLSIALCVVKEAICALLFPNFPLDRPHMLFWARLQFQLNAEIVDGMVIFWCSFFLFRGLGYYQRSMKSENIAAQLEGQLANARLAALRMQLNPHFLFNAMNSISSLMRSNVDAADEMLEQLSSLLRISLERGSTQLIPLSDEIEFIEVYLSMQDRRYSDRVNRKIAVDPELHDVLVPAMILQPIVENAYVHGLSKIEKEGDLIIEAHREEDHVVFTVTNSGVGLSDSSEKPAGHGVGISNLRSRLQLHYGGRSSFEMIQLDSNRVWVRIQFPIQMSDQRKAHLTKFGAA